MASSRIEAIQTGADRYFTGIPCKHGHVAERYVTGSCVACRQGYYRNNREDIVQRMREHRDKNREQIAEQRRAKYRADLGRKKIVIKQYLKRRWFYSRTTNLRGVGAAKAKDLWRLWKAQRGLCALTGRRLTRETAEVDHIIPRTRGGSDRVANLRWVCHEANFAKRAMLDEEFIALCRDVARRAAC